MVGKKSILQVHLGSGTVSFLITELAQAGAKISPKPAVEDNQAGKTTSLSITSETVTMQVHLGRMLTRLSVEETITTVGGCLQIQPPGEICRLLKAPTRPPVKIIITPEVDGTAETILEVDGTPTKSLGGGKRLLAVVVTVMVGMAGS